MMLTPLFIAGLECVLNHILYRERGLKVARQRLNGKTFSINVAEFSMPLTLKFSETKLNVLGAEWHGESDCTVKVHLSVLSKLRERQLLTTLIRRGELDVAGDSQILQHFLALIELAECDPAEYLSPWIGDIGAQSVSQIIHCCIAFLRKDKRRQQNYVAQLLTEEWRVAPGRLELAWFAEEVEAVNHSLHGIITRLNALETR